MTRGAVMSDDKAEEKKKVISNKEINEKLDAAEELIEKISRSFLRSVTSQIKSESRRETISRLFKTGVRAMGVIETMNVARRTSGPKELVYILSQAVERMAMSTEVLGLMEEFMEFLEMKRAQKELGKKFDTKMAN